MPSQVDSLSRRRFLGLAAGAAAISAGRMVQAGTPEASGEQWHRSAQLIRSGALGKIRYCQAGVGVPGRPGEVGWCQAAERDLGPAAGSLCAPLAGLLLVTGSGFPTRVSAAGGAWSGDDAEAPDAMVITAEFSSGHAFVLTASPTRHHGLQAVIRGDKAALTIKNGSARIIHESGKVSQTTAPPSEAPGSPEADLTHWLSACDAGLRSRTVAILAAAVRACRTHTTQHLDPADGNRMESSL
jgi:predicted dehydrogenase